MLKTTFIANVKTLFKVANNSNFQIIKAKAAFICLKQAFTKTFIFYHFNPDRYIHWIKIDFSNYAIGGVLS